MPRPSHEKLPLDIYVSTVEALYSDARSLYAGSISASVAALVTWWKTGETSLLWCGVLLALIGLARGRDMRGFAQQPAKPGTYEEARRWEVRYTIASAAYVAVLGIWCFLTFVRTADAIAHLLSFSVVLAYMVGTTGRNFSSDQIVVTQTICAAVPMISALLLQYNGYYAFLAALLVPFFLSIRTISARLRGVLMNAVVASHDIKLLAVQFDTALNNMPHGLCMFDERQKFVVANSRFDELLGLPQGEERRGMPAHELMLECLRSGRMSPPAVGRFAPNFLAALAAPRHDPIPLDRADGRMLEVAFQPMETGGCVVLIEDITERRTAEAKIEHLARYDALTGLPNRTSFTEHFEAALANIKPGAARAILFIDLDDFKQVNDTLGHSFGDALLCEVAERLRNSVRDMDLVARFGGDEFVVLQTLRRGKETKDAAALAGRIIETLSRIYDIEGHQIVVGASVGISLAPQDGYNVDHLLKNADMALYRAKADGRGVWRFFERDMDVKAQARRTLELDIRDAVAREEFELHYQPLINLRTGRTTTCEALLRWPHPTRGMVSPGEFIPVAEEMGLIVDIGAWVVREACRECARWPSDVSVAVNLSPLQFRRANVEAMVRDALTASGLPPHRLEIEITETVLLQDTAATRRTLRRLRNLGVRIALDDFGTGYSSLSYLQAFPLNKVKIDRSFLLGVEADRRAMKLLRGVARLSVELGMSVVVEGVETQEQLAFLVSEKSVSEVQGFLFSPAIRSADIRKRLVGESEGTLSVPHAAILKANAA
ncbi:putative bifunctional diguanylate cyclase/phosphodiesterase [Ancylobacter sp. sgz301288]|uniref:putative bifunctional diguanylate cyclase/phosphodiesterase n=1 Tax=Ancylobacter sp. sgz301288 TaxID=3342077 RepID=UPI00385D4BAD